MMSEDTLTSQIRCAQRTLNLDTPPSRARVPKGLHAKGLSGICSYSWRCHHHRRRHPNARTQPRSRRPKSHDRLRRRRNRRCGRISHGRRPRGPQFHLRPRSGPSPRDRDGDTKRQGSHRERMSAPGSLLGDARCEFFLKSEAIVCPSLG